MSNLQNSNFGRKILLKTLRDLAGRRLGKRLRRKFVLNVMSNTGLYEDDQSLDTLVSGMNDAHDVELTNTYLLAARWGQTRTTMTDQVYYVDADNGSDITGNGKVSKPFASLWWVGHILPDRIDHNIQIIIKSDITIDEFEIQPKFGPNGSLSIIGEGLPIEVEADQTIDAGGVDINNGATELTVVGTPYGTDTLHSTWLQMTSGDASGDCAPIISNTDRTVTVLHAFRDTYPPVAGDTFRTVIPRYTITTERFLINDTCPNMFNGDRGSRVTIANLQINIRNGTPAPNQNPIKFYSEGGMSVSFVRVFVDQYPTIPVELCGIINKDKSVNTSILALSDSAVANIDRGDWDDGGTNAGMIVKNTVLAPEGLPVLWIRDSRIVRAVLTRDAIRSQGKCSIEKCSSGHWQICGSDITYSQCAFHGTANVPSIRADIDCMNSIALKDVSFVNPVAPATAANYAFEISCCRMCLNGVDLTGQSFAQYAFKINSLSTVNINGSPAPISGDVDDIQWTTSGGAATFPGVRATAVDALGSYVSRMI